MSKSKTQSKPTVDDYRLLCEPVVTEKSSIISMMGNKAVFKVPVSATKTEIKQAIERVFEVDVVQINTARFTGKVKRSPRSASKVGRRASWKKAYVTVQEGQSLSVVEGL